MAFTCTTTPSIAHSFNSCQQTERCNATYKGHPDGNGFLLGKGVLDRDVLDRELAVVGFEGVDVSEGGEDDEDEDPVLSV